METPHSRILRLSLENNAGKTKQLPACGLVCTPPPAPLQLPPGPTQCWGVNCQGQVPFFLPNLRCFRGPSREPLTAHEHFGSPSFNYCSAVIIKSGGNYGNIIPRINTTISPSTLCPPPTNK